MVGFIRNHHNRQAIPATIEYKLRRSCDTYDSLYGKAGLQGLDKEELTCPRPQKEPDAGIVERLLRKTWSPSGA